jgi:hypothetical protein
MRKNFRTLSKTFTPTFIYHQAKGGPKQFTLQEHFIKYSIHTHPNDNGLSTRGSVTGGGSDQEMFALMRNGLVDDPGIIYSPDAQVIAVGPTKVSMFTGNGGVYWVPGSATEAGYWRFLIQIFPRRVHWNIVDHSYRPFSWIFR